MTGEKTPKKQRGLNPALEKYKWQPGKTPNPAGRPKGARSKFSEAFCRDVLMVWEEGGIDAMRRVRAEDPSTFLRVCASLLPKEFNVNDGESALERLLERYGDAELNQLITGLCALGAAGEGGEDTDAPPSGKQPGSVH